MFACWPPPPPANVALHTLGRLLSTTAAKQYLSASSAVAGVVGGDKQTETLLPLV